MDEWEFLDPEAWDEVEDAEYIGEQIHEAYQTYLLVVAFDLAEHVFLSNPSALPSELDEYMLDHLESMEWFTVVQLLDELVDLDVLLDNVTELAALLPLPAVPSEALEDPLGFLSTVLAGNLPKTPSGRKVGSPKLIKIAQSVIQLVRSLPETAQATVRTWATMQRSIILPPSDALFNEEDMLDLFIDPDTPPAMKGFASLLALTMMSWPEQFEGVPMPQGFSDPTLYLKILGEWETLPANPTAGQDGAGDAEALFAQGQLAHILASTSAAELIDSGELSEEERARVYSRFSRAMIWVHDQCRDCKERDEISCRVASNWTEEPVPLLEVAGEMANTGKIAGCIKM